MGKNDLHGVNDVYQFTIAQTIKSKHFKIFTTIIIIGILISMPLVGLITNNIDEETQISNISKVYVIDETGISQADYNVISKEQKEYKNTVFEYVDKSVEEVEEEIINEDNGTILAHITQDESSYNMQFVRAPEGRVSEFEIYEISSSMYDVFYFNLLKSLDITTEQMAMIEAPVITEVQIYSEESQEEVVEEFVFTFNEYYIVLFALLLIMITISYGGSGIASTIVTEKATKLVEILLTRVRPMAIIVGKVLAMLTVTLIQLLLAGISFAISCLAYKVIFNSDSYLPQAIAQFLDTSVFQNVTVITIILAILIYIFGFLFYGFLAGLTGATVSKVEDLQEGMILYTILAIIGAYMGLGLVMMSLYGSPNQVFANITFLLPISSVFITPIYLLMGKVSIGMAILSLVVLIVSTILLVVFTAKIYLTLILHQGNVIKVKDLISISKTSKEER